MEIQAQSILSSSTQTLESSTSTNTNEEATTTAPTSEPSDSVELSQEALDLFATTTNSFQDPEEDPNGDPNGGGPLDPIPHPGTYP